MVLGGGSVPSSSCGSIARLYGDEDAGLKVSVRAPRIVVGVIGGDKR